MSLADKVKTARQESVNKIIESDAAKRVERAAERENKKAERTARREAREAKFKETIGKVKKGITEARSWDRRMMLTLGGEIVAAPKTAEIVTKTGVEAGKRFLNRRVEDVIWGAEAAGNWCEDRAYDIKDFVDSTTDRVVDSVSLGIEKTMIKYEETKVNITNKYLETKENVSDGIKRGKEGLVMSWRRLEAVPHDLIAGVHEKRVARIGERIDRDIARYGEISQMANERRSKANELKGTTRKNIAIALT